MNSQNSRKRPETSLDGHAGEGNASEALRLISEAHTRPINAMRARRTGEAVGFAALRILAAYDNERDRREAEKRTRGQKLKAEQDEAKDFNTSMLIELVVQPLARRGRNPEGQKYRLFSSAGHFAKSLLYELKSTGDLRFAHWAMLSAATLANRISEWRKAKRLELFTEVDARRQKPSRRGRRVKRVP
ncbi:MAG: hypothetical protein ABI887_06770 [Burkholderiales bacterium]